MDKLKIITSTTRPGRKGDAVASWVFDFVNDKNLFNVELLNIAEWALPLLNESAHPRLRKYEHDHTKKWSATIDEADAFIVVLAEYNFGIPAPIKNAIDYLYHEWRYKPIGFVSYGGISGGIRSLQMIKQIVTGLNMMPLSESVSIPSFSKYIDEAGKFQSYEIVEKSLDTLAKELVRWSDTMKGLRAHKGQ
jgi:NAD(P)H-dependent FMN reductase